jgi:hypothetical protein
VSPTGTAWSLPVIRCTPGDFPAPIGTGHAGGGSFVLCYRRTAGRELVELIEVPSHRPLRHGVIRGVVG